MTLREQIDQNTHINISRDIKSSCSYYWHGYSSCKLLNCVATQWGKPLVTKISDKEYDKKHYYNLWYATDTIYEKFG